MWLRTTSDPECKRGSLVVEHKVRGFLERCGGCWWSFEHRFRNGVLLVGGVENVDMKASSERIVTLKVNGGDYRLPRVSFVCDLNSKVGDICAKCIASLSIQAKFGCEASVYLLEGTQLVACETSSQNEITVKQVSVIYLDTWKRRDYG